MRLFKFFLPLLVFLCVQSVSLAAEKKIYTVFIVPQVSPIELNKTWGPVLKKLTQATGLGFDLQILPSIPAFEKTLFKGEPDFAFMNPYHQVVAKQKQGYIPLIRDSAKLLEGILVVRKDSPLKSLKELDGQKVSFPAPNSFAASLYMRALLAGQHINIIPDYVKTHSNVYRSIVLEDAVAGGGVNNTLNREDADIKEELKVFYTTPGSAPHPLSVHPRIPAAIRDKVTKGFLQLAADPANKALLDEVQIPKPVTADYAKDYQPLEVLHLDKFFVTEAP